MGRGMRGRGEGSSSFGLGRKKKSRRLAIDQISREAARTLKNIHIDILTYNDRTVTHLHIKWGVALGPIVVGADTRHLPHSRIHAHVVTLRYKARDEREARDIRTGLAAEPLVRFKSRSSGEPGQASRPLLVLIIQSTPVHCIPHEQIKRSTKPSLSLKKNTSKSRRGNFTTNISRS